MLTKRTLLADQVRAFVEQSTVITPISPSLKTPHTCLSELEQIVAVSRSLSVGYFGHLYPSRHRAHGVQSDHVDVVVVAGAAVAST